MNSEDAMSIIIESLRGGRPYKHADGGCDIHLRGLVHSAIVSRGGKVELHQVVRESPPFMDAAWELCRRGILRPGECRLSSSGARGHLLGLGFSVTRFGEQWLEELGDQCTPSSPDRYAQMLARHNGQLGDGYRERSQDAVKCFLGHAHVACCAMCGAAAESIFLALAGAKLGDPAEALKIYEARGGRGRLEAKIVSGAAAPLGRMFPRYTDLLKYWRDSASHGAATGIGDEEAHSAIVLLLRFAIFASEHWDELTGDA